VSIIVPAVTLLRPLPRRLSRVLTAVILVGWVLQMGWLLRVASARTALSGDLGRYGSAAHWKGIYYRGEKIGFSVSETLPVDGGFELREDAQIQMALLGSRSPARLVTIARVDSAFALRSFTFSLDPGTGPITISGAIDGKRLTLEIATGGGKRTDVRELEEPPNLSLNLSRRFAASGLEPGKTLDAMVFDPATMRNAPLQMEVEGRELVRVAGRPVPAFRVRTKFGSLVSYSWITDLGDVVREESPTGFIVVRESRDRALARAVTGEVGSDLLETVAIKPKLSEPIHDPRAVRCLRLRLESPNMPAELELDGVGQRKSPNGEIELYWSTADATAPPDASTAVFLKPEPFIESDAPEIVAEAHKAVEGAEPSGRAERLTRYVNGLLEKKPTVGLPSALEVLRTRVGDCNEHTALYVAMARALGIPARIAVGLVYMRGAFYYHAWPEAYVVEAPGRAHWVAVDPTLNQYPADATHLRLTRGGLDRQALILPLIGNASLTVVEIEITEGARPVLVGRQRAASAPPSFVSALPRRTGGRQSCWSPPQ
jgi:transglutaminase-like putative cysteine protease